MGFSAAMMALGPLLSAGGSLAGGMIAGGGGLSQGDLVQIHDDPRLDPALQGSLQDALNLVGRGNINAEPDPIQALVGHIQGLPIDEKTKRRGLLSLQDIAAGLEPRFDDAPYLEALLSRVGLDRAGLDRVISQRDEFIATQGRLEELGLNGLNEKVIADRFRAANAASGALGTAADFANGTGPTSDLGRSLLERDNRTLADQRDQANVLANFGNINPAQAFDSLLDAELNQDLRLLEQSVNISQGLTGAFGAGNAIATGAATGNANAIAGAAQLASSQALARNQLLNSNSIDNATSKAQGLQGATDILGTALSSFGGGGGGNKFNLNSANSGGGGGGFANFSKLFGGTGTNSASDSPTGF